MPCAYAAELVVTGDAPKVSEERKTSATSVPGSDWAETYIEKAKKTGLINIGGNYNFPGNINRNDFCELIYNYVELLNNEEKNAAHCQLMSAQRVNTVTAAAKFRGRTSTIIRR